ncbi:MAG: hypothetical protein J6P35_00600, partial [Aeriscardovia sp.]|nr:hypothetical protein [Aeriscardovia sp.]
AGFKHGKEIISGDGIFVVGIGKTSHRVFPVGRVYINYVYFAPVLDKKVLEGLKVVSNNKLVGEAFGI